MASPEHMISIHSLQSEGDATTHSNSRRRSRVACRGCNLRKVRCDVTKTGIPCSNCAHEVAKCEVLPRKKHRPRRDRNIPRPSQSPAQSDPNNNRIVSPQGDASRLDLSLMGLSEPQRPQSLNSDLHLGEDGGNSLSAPIDGEVALPDDSSLSYIGDKRGPRFFVYDLCYPESPQDARPYLLPRQSDITWKPHEVDYLRHQGVFATLPDEVCDDLIRCYFHHVHFFLPVIDADSFFLEYNNSGHQNISLLLFWSMLLAAANFVEEDVLQKAGFASRKAMKTAMYQRAKSLYDLDHGTDKVVLIQSVILMGFWYTDPQDHTGAWYWIGVAIALSQTLGFHRCPKLDSHSRRHSDEQQPLIRRIWWSCLIRDRWLSLAKGRPMRIHHEDCDVPKPGAEDILNNLLTIPNHTKQKFIPAGSEMLANMWVNLVNISDSLGKILRTHYCVNGPKPTIEEINNSAEELRYCTPQNLLNDDASSLLHLHAYHVKLFYEATVAVLYRPYVLSTPSNRPAEAEASFQKMALDRARSAASNTNNILENIIELNTVHLLKPMIITTLIPAMQIHLFDCKSTVPLRRGLGSNKLNLCMLVLSQLRDTYWSASVIYRLFERAQAMMNKSKSSASSQTKQSAINSRPVSICSRNQVADIQYPKQHDDNQDQNRRQQEQQEGLPESNLLLDDQNTPLWPDGSPHLSSLDQILSPSFSISENNFQSFFTGYDTSIMGAYGQIAPSSSDGPVDLVYGI